MIHPIIKRSCIDSGALEIIDCLRGHGFEAFIVGGAVRDLVMGRTPKDWDIVTNAPVERVSTLFPRTVPVGAAFGVTLVIVDGQPYEVAQYRTEGPYEDGRRPSHVNPASAAEDVLRRDFTINALLYDTVTESVIDHTGGLADINGRLISTIGNPETRFAEDRLRMLRAVRFAARLGFSIDPPVMDAIRANASAISIVSPERIGQELAAMFSGEHPESALDLLDRSGLLNVVLPEIPALKGVEQPPEFHPEGDVYTHTREMLRLWGGGTVTLGFGILFHDAGKPSTITIEDRIRFNRHEQAGAEIAEAALKRLRFSQETISRVVSLVAEHMRFVNVRHMRRATIRRFITQEGFDELLELYRLDCLASNGILDTYRFICDTMREESATAGQNAGLPAPLLSGRDLIDLGYTPGQLFGIMLDWVYDEQLEGRLVSREDAIAAVRAKYPAE
jgi:tRNA nucleotidyltransferase/poly(A) polymerase